MVTAMLAEEPEVDPWAEEAHLLESMGLTEEQYRELLAAPEPWEGQLPGSPEAITDTPPGAVLAGLLAAVDLRVCSPAQLVGVAVAAVRLASWAASVEGAATNELTERVQEFRGVGPRPDQVAPEEMAATELGAGLSLSPAAARLRVELARSLQRLPLTRAALAAGEIDVTKARAIADHTGRLDERAAALVEARVLPRAAEQTAAMLRAALRRAVIAVEPVLAEERAAAASADRGVWHESLPDGLGRLEWVGPVEQVLSTWTWLTGAAQQARAGDVSAGLPARTLSQARSDVLGDFGERAVAVADLPRRHGRKPRINVVVAGSTLMGLDDEPAELVGAGPITAGLARRLAGGGTWRRLLTDPRTGRLDEISTTAYEPTPELSDAVVTRDRTCRGLGCRVPADRCDLDHRVPYPAGPTDATNLDPGCRSWHRTKTLTDTTVDTDGSGGLVITLPSGARYRRLAEPFLDHPGLASSRTGADPPDDPDPPPGDPDDIPPF